MGSPAFWETSIIGVMSPTTVRPAAAILIFILQSTTSLQRRSTSSKARLLLPGRPMSASWMPRSSMRCKIASLSPMGGSVTDGFWRPSRSVSSKNVTFFGVMRPLRFTSFQSKMKFAARSESVAKSVMIGV
jgi:hypothetical protein